MGAGIAAGPHCPFALDPAEAVSPATGGFEGRRPRPKPRKAKPGSRVLRGPSEAEASSGFPAGSPSGPKPWRFAVGEVEAEASIPALAGTSGRSLRVRVRQDPGPKPRFRLASPWTEVLGHCRVRSSRAEARSCPTLSRPKPLSDRWQRADRSPAFCRAGPGPEGPVSGLTVPPVRRPLVPMGASRSMPLSHKPKGKPAASAWRRLRQPPRLPLPPGLPPEGDRPDFRLGCGWEGYPPLPEDRLGHIRDLS